MNEKKAKQARRAQYRARVQLVAHLVARDHLETPEEEHALGLELWGLPDKTLIDMALHAATGTSPIRRMLHASTNGR